MLALTDTRNYADIADAIRAKAGTQDTFAPSEMAQAIADIPSGGGDPYPVRGDGNVHLWVRIEDMASPSVCLYFEARNYALTVDWGDGTEPEEHDRTTVNERHEYAAAGTYEITIACGGRYNISIPFTGGGPGCLMGNQSTQNGVTATFPTPDDTGKLAAAELPPVFMPSGYVVHPYLLSGCRGLAKATIHEASGQIGQNAFYSCQSLASVAIPEGVTSIGQSAFNGCYSLRSVSLPSTLASIGTNAFYGCSSLASVAIPEGVTSIDTSAFYGCCRLLSVSLPSTLASIGTNAFYGCSSLASVAIPEGVTSIGSGAFGNCSSLASVAIPGGVTSIDTRTFYGCQSLASVAIPEGVTSIGSEAFYECRNLGGTDAPLVLPSTLASLYGNSFYACNMHSLVMLGEKPPTARSSFQYAFDTRDLVITVPAGSLPAYQSATYWSTYASYMVEAS